ncbi:MAG: septum formation initiator family protein [Nitriliruptoraceae bacterium]
MSTRPRRTAPRPLRWVAAAVTAPFRGDRPLILAVVVSLAVAGMLLMSPAQRYLDAQARVEVLEVKDQVLADEVARLEQRVDDLHDPEHLELLAREQQGFARPGEVVYRIIPPDTDEVAEDPADESLEAFDVDESAVEQPPLHEQVWRLVSGVLGLG